MNNTNGRILSRKELRVILHNFYCTRHVIERLNARKKNLIMYNIKGGVDFLITKENIIEDIENNCILAYYNTDGSVNVAIDEFNYYVFEPTRDNTYFPYVWTLITFKEPSDNNITIYEKWGLAKVNYDRKEV